MSEYSGYSKHRRFDVVQRWFQAVITNPEGVNEGIVSSEAQRWIVLRPEQLEQIIHRSKRLNAQARLSVYAYAYYARLVECLGECFPILKQAVGEEVFSSFAVEYLRQYPSRSYTLDHLGDNFSRFLDEVRPDCAEDGNPPGEVDWPDFFIDLARLEWAIAQVFDGPGAENSQILTPSDLQALSAEDFAQARLIPVVCLRILEFKYPVNAYYTAAREAHENDEVPVPGPSYEAVAITRRDYVVRRYSLTRAQKVLLEALQANRTVSQAIAAAAEGSQMDDDELATHLRSWFQALAAERFFQSVELPLRKPHL